MNGIRLSTFAALAAIAAFGVAGPPALAQDATPINPHFHVGTLGMLRVPHANVPNATTALNQGITAMGVGAPADSGGGDTWPCFTGDAVNFPDCSSLPAGGLLVGIPVQNWPLSDCTNSTTGCGGQIYWTFEDDSAKGALIVSVTVTQGTTTILATGNANLGTVKGSPGAIEIIYLDGIAFLGAGSCPPTGITCGTPVAGPATISVVTTIKQSSTVKTSIKGSAVINLE